MIKKQRGFTLIELLVVIVIIGILAAIGTVTYDSYIKSSRKSLSQSQFQQVYKYVKNDYLLKFDSESFSAKKLTGSNSSAKITGIKNYANALVEYFNDTDKADFQNPYGGTFAVAEEYSASVKPQTAGQVKFYYPIDESLFSTSGKKAFIVVASMHTNETVKQTVGDKEEVVTWSNTAGKKTSNPKYSTKTIYLDF